VIEFPQYNLPEVVDHVHLATWKESLWISNTQLIPKDVMQFIDALDAKLPDFGRIRNDKVWVTGYDLLLSGMKHIEGERVDPWTSYQVDVPYMVAIDNRSTMIRLFLRKGKQGLIDYCRSRVSGTELSRLLEVLHVHVFHEDNPNHSEDYKRMMKAIRASKKITEL
jgi:hypothetical protein